MNFFVLIMLYIIGKTKYMTAGFPSPEALMLFVDASEAPPPRASPLLVGDWLVWLDKRSGSLG